jgi:hypothetical protein
MMMETLNTILADLEVLAMQVLHFAIICLGLYCIARAMSAGFKRK